MRGGIFSPRAAFGGTEFPTNVFAGVNVFLDKRLVVDTVTRRTRRGKNGAMLSLHVSAVIDNIVCFAATRS